MENYIKLGPFKLTQVIGRGGMGEVWAGEHIDSGQGVAVKVLTGEGSKNQEYLRLFRNEIRAVAALNHPGIVLVFDMGEVDEPAELQSGGKLRAGSPYLVMELASYGSLDRFMERVNWPIVQYILFRVLDALSHAHARGMVHRDLKPQNLLVGCAGKDALGLKIADFGLAHPLDLTGRTGRFESGWGTPHYMAPEQFRGRFRDYGPCTDLYALGVIAWELVTGGLPFDGENMMELSSLHLHAELPDFNPRIEVPEAFEGWARRLLLKDINERFPSAAHAAYSLKQLSRQYGAKPPPGEGARELREFEDASIEPEPLSDESAATLLVPGGDLFNDPTYLADSDTTRLLDFSVVDADLQAPAKTQLGDTRVMSNIDYLRPSAAHDAVTTAHQLAAVQEPALPRDWRRAQDSEPAPQLLGAGLGLFGLRTVPMVDRQEERDWLWEQLGAVHEERQGRLVVLRGSTGTGKSRLARWLCERAAEVGAATILSVTHSQIDGAHDGVVPVFARYFGCVGLERQDVERRLERLLKEEGVTEPYEWHAMTELFAPLRDEASDLFASSEIGSGQRTSNHVQLTTDVQRFALLRRAIERLARKRPVILWLDDVQWGYEALAWAKFLLAGPDPVRAPILVLATAHEDSLARREAERKLLDELSEEPYARVHHIAALPPEDTAELVRELLMLDGELAEQVEARCAGNPLFAVQLVGDWVAGGKLRVGAGGFRLAEGESAQIPDGIHQIWGARVEHMLERTQPGAGEALELAAVLGMTVQREEWRDSCRRAGLSLGAELEEYLLAHGLAEAESSAGGGSWRFVHRMLRESLERRSREAGRWPKFNAICAASIASLYRDQPRYAERRARLLLQAELTREACEALLLAARYRVERSELNRAEKLLDQLEALLGENRARWVKDNDDLKWVEEQRAALLMQRAEIRAWAGQFKPSLEFAEQASRLAERHSFTELLAASRYARGRAYLHLGELDLAEEVLQKAHEAALRCEQPQGAARPAISVMGLARVAQARAEYEAAMTLLNQSRDLLKDSRDDHALARCYNALGDVARKSGRLDEAREFAQRARALFESGQNHAGVADCLNDLAELYYLQGDYEAAEEHCAEAIELYESIGSLRAMIVRLNLALLWLERGQVEQARALAARARKFFERERQLAELALADAILMGCAASDEAWVVWDELFAEAHHLCTTTGLRDPHIGQAVELAARIAEERREAERAKFARALAQMFGAPK